MADPYKVVGRDWNEGPVDQAKDEWTVDEFGDKITRTYRTLWSIWRAQVPAIGAAHPLSTLCQLKSATARKTESAVVCEVVLRYEQDEPSDEDSIPAPDVSESGAVIQIDITAHPKFDTDFKQYWDADAKAFKSTAPAYLRGVTKYVVGSSTVTITTYSREEPADVQGELGMRANPGHGYGHSGHWLVISGGKNKQGMWWARQLVYQFSAQAVPTQIYS